MTTLSSAAGQQHQPHQHQPEIRFIPVSVSKSARGYFNIARKALETHRCVELSALEAAVVIAVDASFLLTRAKMATIERVSTAFVQVPSHQHGYGHLRKARIQIVLRKTPEFDAYMRANPRPPPLPAGAAAEAGAAISTTG